MLLESAGTACPAQWATVPTANCPAQAGPVPDGTVIANTWHDAFDTRETAASKRDRMLCLHTIIESWAQVTPDAVAVVYEGRAVTYRELNNLANALADRLCGHGIEVGSLVGIAMKRSPKMIVGLLAILKSGGAFVPIDPRLPQERLKFLVSDAKLAVVLTHRRSLDAGDARVIDVADPTNTPQGGGTAKLRPEDVRISNADLAYVIYTSGSTGQPKGAMIPHRGVVNWLVWMRDTFEVTPADVVLKKAPLTFDVSVWELFLPLISGAKLVLADSDRQHDPAYLAGLMSETRVSIAQFVPSLMRSFLEQPDLPDLSALRHVMCGGEVLSSTLQSLFFKRLTAEVCNSYGPTECSIGVTRWPCRRDDTRDSVPIGYAIDNTELYILDTNLDPVAVGEPGELFIGGVCVGHGYLNRPDLTAEKFLPNPFDPAGETRMYRTGDRCRFLPDGSIDFLGRLDDQVKVRGVRIELGEVEKHIQSHDAVQAAAAALDETDRPDGDPALVAYVVRAPGATLTERDLRSFLRQKLPLAMIPSALFFVDDLPLSANGKVDRKRLQSLRQTIPTAPVASVVKAESPPRDDLEQRLCAIWQTVLRNPEIGIRDDFFECGGDSLLAMNLVLRVESAFRIKVTLDQVLDHFTVEAFARILRAQGVDPTRLPQATAMVSGALALEIGLPRPARVPTSAPAETICRLATLNDIPGILPVCARVFPAYAKATLAEFRELCEHRWLNNPFRTERDPFGWVLQTPDGRIVGFHGLVPQAVWAGGHIHPAISPTTWAVEPGFGKGGLTLLSTYLEWAKDRFLLNTTANAITSAMHASSNFGMRKIPIDDFDQRLLWLLDVPALVRWKLDQNEAPSRLHRLAKLAPVRATGAMLAPFALGIAGGTRAGLAAGLGRSRIRFACRKLDIGPVTQFGPEFDALWDRLKDSHPVTVVRSAAMLNWRHIHTPKLLGPSYALACREAGELLGYVALREAVTTAPGHFIVTDLFYDTARPEILHNLMNAAFDFAVARSATVLEVFGFHPTVMQELRTQHPYLLRRGQLERLGRGVSLTGVLGTLRTSDGSAESSTYWYRTPSPELEQICSAGRWWPSGIDGDLNL